MHSDDRDPVAASRCPEAAYENATDCPVCLGEPSACPELRDHTAAQIREHPCFDRCFRVYRNALAEWHSSGAIQSAARMLGMSARAYADARLTANQFSWTSSSTGNPFTREHADLAYKLAVEEVSGVTA